MPARPSRYEHTRCFRRGWVFERVGWVTIGATLVAAALGLFGNGWLSGAEATAGEGFTVQYRRFCRARTPLELTIEWQPPAQDAALWIARPYLDRFEIEEIRPAPLGASIGRDRVYYTFKTLEPGQSVAVRFTLKPAQAGSVIGHIGSDGGLAVEIRQLVFP
jgi:hypothetical protein